MLKINRHGKDPSLYYFYVLHIIVHIPIQYNWRFDYAHEILQLIYIYKIHYDDH